MVAESLVRFADQLAIEALAASSRFISRDQQDRTPLRIERKGHPPLASARAETEFLHVGVSRAFQRINARPAQLWTKTLEESSHRKHLDLDVVLEYIEFRFKLVADLYGPRHS